MSKFKITVVTNSMPNREYIVDGTGETLTTATENLRENIALVFSNGGVLSMPGFIVPAREIREIQIEEMPE